MLIGVPRETAAGETRVAVTPETAKKLKAQGSTVRVESGAGVTASVTDAAYAAAGAEIVDRATAFGSELVLKVRSPSAEELKGMKSGTALVGMLNPFDRPGLEALAAAGLTSFALEAAPRTTRAQSMDVLSSQANIAGYKAVMVAANTYQRFMSYLVWYLLRKTPGPEAKRADLKLVGRRTCSTLTFSSGGRNACGSGLQSVMNCGSQLAHTDASVYAAFSGSSDRPGMRAR